MITIQSFLVQFSLSSAKNKFLGTFLFSSKGNSFQSCGCISFVCYKIIWISFGKIYFILNVKNLAPYPSSNLTLNALLLAIPYVSSPNVIFITIYSYKFELAYFLRLCSVYIFKPHPLLWPPRLWRDREIIFKG